MAQFIYTQGPLKLVNCNICLHNRTAPNRNYDLNLNTCPNHIIYYFSHYKSLDIHSKVKMSTHAEVYDIIIIGAGPCGLAVAARLREETPSAMFTDEEHQRYHWIKKHQGKMSLARARTKRLYGTPLAASAYTTPNNTCCGGDGRGQYSTLVLDSSGTQWMARWNRAFETLKIDYLRSPMFFHVDPADRDGLLAYTRETGREKELYELSGCVGQELSKHKRKKIRNLSRYVYNLLLEGWLLMDGHG